MHGLFTQHVIILQKEYLCMPKVAIMHLAGWQIGDVWDLEPRYDAQWIFKMSSKYLIVPDVLSDIWKFVISVPETYLSCMGTFWKLFFFIVIEDHSTTLMWDPSC